MAERSRSGGEGQSLASSPTDAVRLGRLEMEVGHLQSMAAKMDGAVATLNKAVEDLRLDYARFDERLKRIPTKEFIFATAGAMFVTTIALTALIVRFLPPAS